MAPIHYTMYERACPRSSYSEPDESNHVIAEMVSVRYRELFPRGKAVGEQSLPLPFSVDFKNAWSYTSTFLYVRNGV
jgi:hypothetical protein